jgi:hypothetical protein
MRARSKPHGAQKHRSDAQTCLKGPLRAACGPGRLLAARSRAAPLTRRPIPAGGGHAVVREGPVGHPRRRLVRPPPSPGPAAEPRPGAVARWCARCAPPPPAHRARPARAFRAVAARAAGRRLRLPWQLTARGRGCPGDAPARSVRGTVLPGWPAARRPARGARAGCWACSAR